MRKVLLVLVVVGSMGVGALLGGAYTQNRLAQKFDKATKILNYLEQYKKNVVKDFLKYKCNENSI